MAAKKISRVCMRIHSAAISTPLRGRTNATTSRSNDKGRLRMACVARRMCVVGAFHGGKDGRERKGLRGGRKVAVRHAHVLVGPAFGLRVRTTRLDRVGGRVALRLRVWTALCRRGALHAGATGVATRLAGRLVIANRRGEAVPACALTIRIADTANAIPLATWTIRIHR